MERGPTEEVIAPRQQEVGTAADGAYQRRSGR
jgi:hypothetical protein